jgi:hypothetical protein
LSALTARVSGQAGPTRERFFLIHRSIAAVSGAETLSGGGPVGGLGPIAFHPPFRFVLIVRIKSGPVLSDHFDQRGEPASVLGHVPGQVHDHQDDVRGLGASPIASLHCLHEPLRHFFPKAVTAIRTQGEYGVATYSRVLRVEGSHVVIMGLLSAALR